MKLFALFAIIVASLLGQCRGKPGGALCNAGAQCNIGAYAGTCANNSLPGVVAACACNANPSQVIQLLPTPSTESGEGWYVDGPYSLLPVESVSGGIQFTFENYNQTGEADGYLVQWNWGGNIPMVQPFTSYQTIYASGSVNASPDAVFKYYGFPWDPSNGPGIPANCRMYFSTGFSDAGGLFNESAGGRWWSPTATVYLVPGTYNFSISAPISSTWTNVYGASSTSQSLTYDPGNNNYYVPSQAFKQAIANPSEVGLTCGGGYFYGHGVATTQGTAILTLSSFYIQ